MGPAPRLGARGSALRVYGYPLTSAGDWDGVDVAQQWAQILGLVEFDRDQQWAQLRERHDPDVRVWHGVVSGIRVIILVETGPHGLGG